METVTIRKISRREKTKRDGKGTYISLGIITDEYGQDKWLSGFGNSSNKNWKEGDKVEIIVEPKGDYLNFDTPKKEKSSAPPSADLAQINAKLDHIITLLTPKATASPAVGHPDRGDYEPNDIS